MKSTYTLIVVLTVYIGSMLNKSLQQDYFIMSIFYLSIDDIKTIKHAKQVLNILNNNIFFLHFINLAIDVPNVENNTACVSSVQKKKSKLMD